VHEADHSLHLVPKSKNTWNYTSTPQIRLHGVLLSLKKKQKDNFTLPYSFVNTCLLSWRR